MHWQLGQFGDDQHFSDLTGGAPLRVVSRQFEQPFLIGDRWWFGDLSRQTQQLSATRQVAALAAVGQETEMADAHERGRQRMQQEAADEFFSRNGQGLGSVVVVTVR
jgi:hypothetical protein